MRLRDTLLATLCLALSPQVAGAQPISGLYVGGDLGANIRETSPSSNRETSPSSNGRIQFGTNPGPVGIGAVGWGFGNGVRVELEGSYRSNGISSLATRRTNGALENTGNPSGRISTTAVMANVYYDINLAPFGLPLRPYLGGGVGYGWETYHSVSGDEPLLLHLPGNNTAEGPGQAVFDGTNGHFAWQAIAGIAMPLPGIRGLDLTAEYRFFGMEHVGFSETSTLSTTNSINGAIPSSHGTGYADSNNHAILIGLRYRFQ